MRSGGVVGKVQEEVACDRKPVPTRYPQPLSQGLSALPAPLTQGSQALRGTEASLRGSQALRGTEASLRGSQALRGTEASLRGRQDLRGTKGQCAAPCGKPLHRKKPALRQAFRFYFSGCFGWVLVKSFASHCSTRSRGKCWLMSRATITPTPVSKMRLTA